MDVYLELVLLKVAVAPAFVGAVSLIALRFGQRFAGWLVALPVNTGTIVVVLAMTEGPTFAASAASGALAGVISLSAFVAGYALTAHRHSWFTCLAAASAAFTASTLVLSRASLPLALGVAGALLSILVVYPAIRTSDGSRAERAVPRWEIPARMLTAGGIVLAITTSAGSLGAQLSGLLAPIPVFSITLVAFTHSRQGAAPVFEFLRGLVYGLVSFAGFCTATAVLTIPYGIATAVAVGLTVFVGVYLLMRVAAATWFRRVTGLIEP